MKGLITALITPYKNGKVDQLLLQELVKFQVESHIDGIVVCGSTGEGGLLTYKERELIIKTAKEHAGDVPIFVGCGAPSTKAALDQALQAKECGADGILVITPYYSKPKLEGVFEHFKTIHDACEIPMLIYNHPGRTGIDLPVDFIGRLFDELGHVMGVKDSTTDTSRMAFFAKKYGAYSLLCGDDPFAASSLAQGANGCVSITSNVLPKEMKCLLTAWSSADLNEFRKINQELMPVHYALVCETNPVPAKYAAFIMNMSTDEVRLPLVDLSNESKKEIKSALQPYLKNTLTKNSV